MPPRKKTQDAPEAGTDLLAGGDGTGGTKPEGDAAVAGDDVEAAEAREIEAVAEARDFDDPYFATGDCRDAMLEIIKRVAPWSTFKEGQQRDIIAAVANSSVTIVQKIARAIAANGCQTVMTTLEQLTVKDGLKVTLKGPFSHDALIMLGEAQGKVVLLSLPDSERYDHNRAPAAYDPDKPELPLAGPEGDDDLVNAADAGDGLPPSNRKVVREGDQLKVVHKDTGVDLGDPTDAEREAFEAAERGENDETEIDLASGMKITLRDGDKHAEEEATGDELAGRWREAFAEGDTSLRINLQSGMIEGRKEGRDGSRADDWDDVRNAEPAEMAAERERQADFEDGDES